jgi:hypothetical protein
MSFARCFAMTLLCPICKFPAQEFSRSGDATGFYCTTHGHFKVADSIAVDDPRRMGSCVACGEVQSDGRGMACYKARRFLQVAESPAICGGKRSPSQACVLQCLKLPYWRYG